MSPAPPPLVFASPVAPSFRGRGLAMRAAHTLRALARRFEVHLVVLGLYDDAAPGEEVLGHCRDYRHLAAPAPRTMADWPHRPADQARWGESQLPPEWGACSSQRAATFLSYLEAVGPTLTWAFRFHLTPWLHPWMQRGERVVLDLDECESAARRRLADLYRTMGMPKEAMFMRAQAAGYQNLERRFLPEFARLVVASAHEATHLATCVDPDRLDVWPNVVTLPPVVAHHAKPTADGAYHLMFVGFMGYLPNPDAVAFAAQEILPRLRRQVARPVVFHVAGAGTPATGSALARLPGIDFLGEVAELRPLYEKADLVLVPLRTGAGTRIKILEAFAHGKAVVSTSIGAEGLAVRHGVELLLADDPSEFAAACAALLTDDTQRERLAQAGHAFVGRHHSGDVLAARVDELVHRVDA